METPNCDPSPHFTRRHYIWLATAMRRVATIFPDEVSNMELRYGINRGIEIFAEVLKSDNPNFDKDLFLKNVFDPETNNH
jgi:hypothetical protein